MEKQDTENYGQAKLIAQAKFALIAPVVSGTYPDDSISAYFRRIAAQEVEWPTGGRRRFSDQTLKQWLFIYRHQGLEGLMPKRRTDSGRSRKLTQAHREYISQKIEEFPNITAVMVREMMIKDGIINEGDVSVDTVQRYIRNSGARSGAGRPAREVRSWDFARSCDGYEADTCHTMYIYDTDGSYRKTYLTAIIDVHSRMIVGAEFFFSDRAVNFQKVWKEAVLRYGRSRVIIMDNGSAYRNASNADIEARLGTRVIYNPPRQPTGKAVIERFFRTIKDRWLNADHGSSYRSIGDLNTRLRTWVNEYNSTAHSALADDPDGAHTPLERYMADMKDTRPCQLANKPAAEYAGWVEDVFLHETTRKVNGDSTVTIDHTSFDVPSRYIDQRVLIRYEPRDLSTVYLYDTEDKSRVDLKRTDRVENGLTRRTEIIYQTDR